MSRISSLAACAALGLGLLAADTAEAGLEACGNFYVAADASCEWIPKEESCTTECEPVAVQSSCAAELYLECEGECSASAETTCVETCETTCVTDCDPEASEPPNCMGLCMSDCQMDCTDACADADDEGACRSSCAHTCSEGCQDECKGGESCESVCTQACSGSCKSRANIDCQVSCQGQTFTECETRIVDDCTTRCEEEGGALFCDGNYVASGSAQECVLAIESEIQIDVEGWIEGDCEDPEGATDVLCEIEGGLSCAVVENSSNRAALAFMGLALFALAGLRREGS